MPVSHLSPVAPVPLTSWVVSANGHPDFPLENLPFGVFRRAGSSELPRVGVAIGDHLLDIVACQAAGVFRTADDAAVRGVHACAAPALNALMALGAPVRRALRTALTRLLAHDASAHDQQIAQQALIAQTDAELLRPVQIGDYTDFYASVHHATNVGAMFRPDNPLLPNYKWVPIGYHGRASSVVVSGTPVTRPSGQRKGPNDAEPTVGPSRSLDYELELGVFVGPGNALGDPIALDAAEDHLWGVCLLNDWSARDIQSWEYQPLGPFLAKNFATTISPWVVTMDALEPFRAPLAPRAEGDPAPLPYLHNATDAARGGLALTVEVWLRTARMRAAGDAPVRISHGSSLDLYWSFAQMLTHHASGGCNLCPGDLLGSGTISGAAVDSRGCLLELTQRGARPLSLPNGEQRGFLDDGDEVILTAFAERDGAVRIGFGRCAGEVRPAR